MRGRRRGRGWARAVVDAQLVEAFNEGGAAVGELGAAGVGHAWGGRRWRGWAWAVIYAHLVEAFDEGVITVGARGAAGVRSAW